MVMVPAEFDEESFLLYKKYQMAVHGDPESKITTESYTNFLVESPLIPAPVGGMRKPNTVAQLQEATEAAIDDAALAQLVAMGFPASMVKSVLVGTNGDVNAATELLLTIMQTGQGHEMLQPTVPPPRLVQAVEALHKAWRDGEGAGAGVPIFQRRAKDATTAATNAVGMPGFDADFAAGEAGDHAPPSGASGEDMRFGYGSFHQRYYLDGRLIAVGVVDVLPLCMSSVYLFYDPELPKWQLGKLTALREIQWVQLANRVSPRLRYYYMGFYIHTCPKMRYKADYSPSDLLCPVRHSWVPASVAMPLIDASKFAALSGDDGSNAPDPGTASEVVSQAQADAAGNDIILWLNNRMLRVDDLTERGVQIVRNLMREFIPRAGTAVALRSLVKLQ